VKPLTIESQFQAGWPSGVKKLMAKGAITLKDGYVEQSNFDTYTPPYIIDAPVAVAVHIVPRHGETIWMRASHCSCDSPAASTLCPVDWQALPQLAIGDGVVKRNPNVEEASRSRVRRMTRH